MLHRDLITIRKLNNVLLPALELPSGYQPKKHKKHIDPRALMKKRGAGKGNWGTTQDLIDDGIMYEQITRKNITVFHSQNRKTAMAI
jgi:hypothetical protein